MSLNLECLRDTLLLIEKESIDDKWIFYSDSKLLASHGAKEVVHHLKLCRNVGWLANVVVYLGKYAIVDGITEEGRAFIDKIRDVEFWNLLTRQDEQLTAMASG